MGRSSEPIDRAVNEPWARIAFSRSKLLWAIISELCFAAVFVNSKMKFVVIGVGVAALAISVIVSANCSQLPGSKEAVG